MLRVDNAVTVKTMGQPPAPPSPRSSNATPRGHEREPDDLERATGHSEPLVADDDVDDVADGPADDERARPPPSRPRMLPLTSLSGPSADLSY